MECSVCGDVSFQIYLFRCTKCSIRFQHQYCSRAYFKNESVESISEVCDWCFSIPEDSVKIMRSSAGFRECTNMTRNRKCRRIMRKPCVGIDRRLSKLLKRMEKTELRDSMERKNKKRYKLLDEILC
ncbi:uncharacterized protein LOC131036917 [Cryptomeria japonica]|uniref:uncharacterized protein LOC131036917 n=1 Tax=Cryptomeria japonica TaxID=3369 RepID=UPI0025AC0955|nr:uncharacterized protein LOC131036917 [Cryptomeria japonica]